MVWFCVFSGSLFPSLVLGRSSRFDPSGPHAAVGASRSSVPTRAGGGRPSFLSFRSEGARRLAS